MTQSSDPVAVFWDYENCPVPASASGYSIANNIYTLVRPYGSVKLFRAYLQINEQLPCSKSLALRSELQSSGVSLVDCPHNGRKDVADKMMLVDLLAYAIDVPPPSTIVLITGDRDFAYGLSVLRLRRYRVVLVTLPHAHASLTLQASICFDWSKHITAGSSNQAEPSTQNPVPQPPDSTPAPWLQPTSTNGHESQTAETEVGDPEYQTRRELSFSQNSFIGRSSCRKANGLPTVNASSSKRHDPFSPTLIINDNCSTAPLAVHERPSTKSNCCHLTSNHHAVLASPPLVEESPIISPQTLDDKDIDPEPGSSPGGIGPGNMGTCSVPMCGQVPAPAFRATDTVPESAIVAVPTVADKRIEPDPLADVLLPSPLISSSQLESSSGMIRGATSAVYPESSSRSSISPARSEPLASPPFRPISAIDKPGHPIRRVFLPLLNELESHGKKGQHRPLRSVVGLELGKQHNVYQKAGVKTFKEYIAMAEREGVVTAGGTGGHAWVSFKPQWSNVCLMP